jgi:peptide/nickel transport system ATP-binding protein/oligopeptide transport system ATP-binding protein
MTASPLLQVCGLSVAFPGRHGLTTVVDSVGFDVDSGQTLAIVGETGCGKSLTGLSIPGLIPSPGIITAGAIRLAGEDLVGAPEKRLEQLRGSQIGMIFQDPLTSLDPIYMAGEQIAEGLRFHRQLGRREAWREAVDRLAEVGIPDPEARARSFPHQLSGGMRQRVMIAAAIACQPRLLIADEPTTALDVTIQAQVLDLLGQLLSQHNMSLILITHDLGVVRRLAHRVLVMYAGQIVESGEVEPVLESPAHPYTAGLVAAVPRVSDPVERLATIEGTVPAPGSFPPGCRFQPRCRYAGPGCSEPQSIRATAGGRAVRCLYPLPNSSDATARQEAPG